MRATVALEDCPLCECDVTANAKITVADALAILSRSVGLDVELYCFLPIPSGE
jgi:hypothetical protein